jgi:6-pyruvoyltetrahydropterin/6-carboxytetrahydropterin synthase
MARMEIKKIFEFAAAHNLVDYNGKCENLHGHNYKLEITLSGEVQKDGMVIDFTLLKKIVKDKIIAKLDHTYLNDFFSQPTAENMTLWIWKELEAVFKEKKLLLQEVVLYETPTSVVIYRGE